MGQWKGLFSSGDVTPNWLTASHGTEAPERPPVSKTVNGGRQESQHPVGKDQYSEWGSDTFALCLDLCSIVIIKWTLAMRIWASERIDMRVPGPLADTPMERCSNPMHHEESLGPYHHVYTALFLLFTSQKTCEKPDTLSLLTFLILLRHFV